MVAVAPIQTDSERGSASSQYDLLARLATGGMAEIFLARANSLAGFERYVVLKRIRREKGDDARWVAMFLDEARLAAQLQHPNIAQVFDLGQIGDEYFYTMEYVHGEDVLDILTRTNQLGRAMPVPVALAIAAHACGGLAHAHARCAPDGRPLAIVHRDITPSNLMVSFEGTVKIVDFGVAKARFRSIETQAGTIMGKIGYLSPEQCTTGVVDHRSDLFSLGIVLYEMLTGTRLFKRETDYETLRAVANDHPIAPSSLVGGLPRGLDEIVLRALAKDPAHRFPTAHEMLDALEQCTEAANVPVTANVLRRYMRDLYGAREEPWRALERAVIPMLEDADIELLEDSAPRAFHGLPLDAAADRVPMLDESTGMIDLEALSGSPRARDSRPLSPGDPGPVRGPSAVGSGASLLDGEHAGDRFDLGPIPTGSIVSVPLPVPGARPVTQTSLLRAPISAAAPMPAASSVRRTLLTTVVRRPRRVATVAITAVAVVAIAAGGYLAATRGRAAPASVAGARSGPAPTVTHIEDLPPAAGPSVSAAPPPPPKVATPSSASVRTSDRPAPRPSKIIEKIPRDAYDDLLDSRY